MGGSAYEVTRTRSRSSLMMLGIVRDGDGDAPGTCITG
jgi:hypothetical protein